TDLLVQRENGPLEWAAVGQGDVEELGVVVRRAGEAHREAVDAALAVRRIRARVRSLKLVPDGDLRDAGLADVDPTVDGARAPERRLEKGLDLRSRGIEHQAGKIHTVAPWAVEVCGKRIPGAAERELEGQACIRVRERREGNRRRQPPIPHVSL